jgi:hypothetical protein
MKANMILIVCVFLGLSLPIFSAIPTNGQRPNADCTSSLSVTVNVMTVQDSNVTTDPGKFTVSISELHMQERTDKYGRCILTPIQGTEGGTYDIVAYKSERGICWIGDVRNVKIQPCSGSKRGLISDIKIDVKPSRTGC